jgi:hypothetical protein
LRRALVQINYITWSFAVRRLVARRGQNNKCTKNTNTTNTCWMFNTITPWADLFCPSKQRHLDEVLYQLSQMDFMIDLAQHNNRWMQIVTFIIVSSLPRRRLVVALDPAL